MVGGQYVVAGAIAHGGLGWIYAARDRNVSDRWVVLKGLLNSGDPDALAAAIAERQFLAQVEHPLIVEIYNFVTHEGAGYIVMEYVGGTSLKQLLKERMRAAGGSVRPAAGRPGDRLHHRGPARLPVPARPQPGVLRLQARQPHPGRRRGQAHRPRWRAPPRRPRLRDLRHDGLPGAGGARTSGPSVASDIYTIGRTLTVLAMEFRGYQSTYVASLPPVDETPLFQKHDSLYRLLLKACAPDPADRFVSADELRVQLLGVLREVVALEREGAAEHSTSSLLFDVPTVADDSLDWQDLPRLRTDDSDPQMPWLRTVSIDDPVQRLAALAGAPANSPEVLLARARAALEAGQLEQVDDAVRTLLADDPWEWRAVWMSGPGRPRPRARRPRRRAPSTRSTARCPASWRPSWPSRSPARPAASTDVAESLYVVCARTDANYIAPAAFGLARIRSGRGDVDGRGPRPGPGPGDEPGVHPGSAPPGRPARRVGRRAAVARGRPGQHREPHDRPRRPVALPGRGARPRRWASSSRTGADTDGRHRRPARGRARPARRAGGGLPRPGRLRLEP